MHNFHATKINRVKKGGPNVTSNAALVAVLEKVKELDVPKDIVDRNIKKATEKGQEAYIEKIYEVSKIGKHKFYCVVTSYTQLDLSPLILNNCSLFMVDVTVYCHAFKLEP